MSVISLGRELEGDRIYGFPRNFRNLLQRQLIRGEIPSREGAPGQPCSALGSARLRGRACQCARACSGRRSFPARQGACAPGQRSHVRAGGIPERRGGVS